MKKTSSERATIRGIVTHNGIFHADEVFATAVVMIATGVSKENVFRTRDETHLKRARWDREMVVLDVGGQYDPIANNFDHHQREGRPEPRSNGVPYSSLGLAWKQFGGECVVNTLLSPEVHPSGMGDVREEGSWAMLAATSSLMKSVDDGLIQGIDAADCGMVEHNTVLRGTDVSLRLVNLSGVIGSFNPGTSATDEERNNSFFSAVALAGTFLKKEIKRAYQQKVLAPEAVKKGFKRDQRLIVLEEFTSWQEAAVLETDALYCVYPATGGTWNVQQVPAFLGSYEGRKGLPESWRGLPKYDLASVTGVEDVVFCHVAGFVCGAKTLAGALTLANKAVEY